MKSAAISIFFFVLAATIFYYGERSEKKVVKVVVLPPPLPPSPLPPSPARKPKIIIPNLKTIPVRNGRTITNARILSVNPDGIIFICDFGMVQALFDDLPPEFRAYYASKAVSDSPPEQPVVAQQQVDQQPSPQPEPSQYDIDLHQADEKFKKAQRMEELNNAIASDQSIIHHYETQSDFENNPNHPNITDGAYECAKADLEKAQIELQQLKDSD